MYAIRSFFETFTRGMRNKQDAAFRDVWPATPCPHSVLCPHSVPNSMPSTYGLKSLILCIYP
jgi:hypothetical protein